MQPSYQPGVGGQVPSSAPTWNPLTNRPYHDSFSSTAPPTLSDRLGGRLNPDIPYQQQVQPVQAGGVGSTPYSNLSNRLGAGGAGGAPTQSAPGLPSSPTPRSPAFPRLGLPEMRLPKLPSLPKLPNIPSVPPGLGMALGRGVGFLGFVPALKEAFDRQQHLNERFQEILFPPPPAQPGFNRLPNVPSRPTPPPAPPGVPGGNTDGQYAVTIRSVATNVDSGEQTVSNFTLTTGGPIWGIRTESDADTLSYFLISGELAQTAIPIGGASGTRAAEVLTVTIANIQRLDAPTDPDTRPPYPQPQRTFPPTSPAAPQYPQRQPIGAPPGMNPNQPPGQPSAPGQRGAPGQPTGADPLAPTFPTQSPSQPSQPSAPGLPGFPLPIGMPVGAPGARSASGSGTAGGPAAGGSNPNNPMPSPPAEPTAPPTNPPVTPTDPTGLGCRFQYDQLVRNGVAQANTGITAANVKITAVEAAQIALDAYIAKETATINSKLGPQLPNGGIGGKLGRIGGMISKLYNNLGIDRALAVFTWIGVVHNAYMLSNSLAQTLFSAIGSSLDAIGIQKMDEDGNESPYEVGEMVAKYTDNAMRSLFGVETWNGIKDTWRKYNRIYQAAANIINAMQSMMQSMLQALEIIGQYVSKIGNAAKTFGVFAENCYSWMAPNFNFMNGKFFRFMNGAQDVLENIDQVAQEVVNIQQTAGELQKQQTELNKAVADATEEKTKVEERQKAESRGAAVTANDERKPNP